MKKKWGLKLGVFVLGQFVLAFGVSLSVLSELGVTPVSSLPKALSTITGMEMGNMLIVVQCACFVLQALFFEREYKVGFWLQVPSAILFGKLVTLTSLFFEGIVLESYWVKLVVQVISIFIVGLGVELYMLPGVALQPMEGMVEQLHKKYGRSVAFYKNVVDISCVVLAVVLSLVFLGRLEGAREGTVMAAIGVGRAVWLFHKLFGARLEKALTPVMK